MLGNASNPTSRPVRSGHAVTGLAFASRERPLVLKPVRPRRDRTTIAMQALPIPVLLVIFSLVVRRPAPARGRVALDGEALAALLLAVNEHHYPVVTRRHHASTGPALKPAGAEHGPTAALGFWARLGSKHRVPRD